MTGAALLVAIMLLFMPVAPVLAGPDDLPPVEVIESAEAVAASREEYAARRGIRDLEAIRPAILRGEKEPWAAFGDTEKRPPVSLVRELFLELHGRRASLSPASRLVLGKSLYGWRCAEGKEILLELLAEADAGIRREAIERIHWGAAENAWPFSFTEEDLARIRAALDDPDETVRCAARSACAHLGVPGAEAQLIAWLRGAVGFDDVEARSIFVWGNIGYHASETWRTFLLEVLGDGPKPEDRHLVVPAANVSISHMDRRVAELAERRCEDDFVARRAADPDSWFTGWASLTQFAGKRSAPFIEKALIAPSTGYQAGSDFRGNALEAYGRADPEKAAPYLLDAFDRAKERSDARGAIQGLVHAADPESAPTWTARILKKLDAAPAILSFDAVVPLFWKRGGAAGRRIVMERFHKLDGSTRLGLADPHRGTDVQEVFRDLHAAGLIRALPARELVARVAHSSEIDPGSFSIVEPVLRATGDVIYFDAEADEKPVRHDILVEYLAEGTRGVFRVHDVWQTWNRTSETAREGDYTVRFSVGNTLFRFRARDRSDWYDIEAVMQALNKALDLAGRPERFLYIFGSGQSVSYIFADEERLAVVCRKHFIPFGSGEVWRKAAEDYEKRVLEKLRKE